MVDREFGREIIMLTNLFLNYSKNISKLLALTFQSFDDLENDQIKRLERRKQKFAIRIFPT
jgi:hypothetical protein